MKTIATIIALGLLITAGALVSGPRDSGKGEITATLTTTDNTTNDLYSFSVPSGTVVRVSVDVIANGKSGPNVGQPPHPPSADYGRICGFACDTNGVIRKIGVTAAIGIAEEDSNYECILDTDGSVVRIRVAGNTGNTVDWTGYIKILYGY